MFIIMFIFLFIVVMLHIKIIEINERYILGLLFILVASSISIFIFEIMDLILSNFYLIEMNNQMVHFYNINLNYTKEIELNLCTHMRTKKSISLQESDVR